MESNAVLFSNIFMVVGFILASYSVVGNDAIQTLGTFISSNSNRPWWVLYLYAGTILAITLLFSWYTYDGDVSYQRLAKKFPPPEVFTWVHAIPPLILLLLTRMGIPLSTTFLVLTVFSPGALGSMLIKSLAGYGVAFAVGIAVYFAVSKAFEAKVANSKFENNRAMWTILQWMATGFLWSQWLIQDLANIYVYSPTRSLPAWMMLSSLAILLVMLGYIFATKGGKIQEIVLTKYNTLDVRSATIIDLIFGIILLIFKNWSNIPMSTTWVFLGLLAGREIAITVQLKIRKLSDTYKIVGLDSFKALIGLVISVLLAYALPMIDSLFS